jgi:hypothetical protein
MSENVKQTIVEGNVGRVIGGMGSTFPVVVINNYTFSTRELLSLDIINNEAIPRLNLTVRLNTGVFRAKHLPADGDVISVFIRADNTLFKPIKCDFLIIKCSTSSKRGDNEGTEQTWFFTGILNVPLLRADLCLSFKEQNSFDTLKQTVEMLGCGFVSNEEKTEDVMTWISPNISYFDFIEQLVIHSYKDTKSFFDGWIDWYYQFNFQNIASVLEVDDDHDLRDGIFKGALIDDTNSKTGNQYIDGKLILTNSNEAVNTNMYFDSFEYVNNAGLINSVFGYKRNVHFYDEILDGKQLVELMAIKDNTKAKDHVMNLGRPGEDYYKSEVRNKWIGTVMNKENVHKNYHIAEEQNNINMLELKKNSVIINLPNVNFNIYRGMLLPVRFVVKDDPNLLKVAGDPEDKMKTTGYGIDRSLSGNWYVSGMTLKYQNTYWKTGDETSGEMLMTVQLSRREYKMPLSPKNTYIPIDRSLEYDSNTTL